MTVSHAEHYALATGTAVRLGGLIWPRPYFPTLHERATFIAGLIPPWAIASGRTAGWVWTGMGQPEPWSILRPLHPAPSPLDRMHWGARTCNPLHHERRVLQGLHLLTQEATAMDILVRERSVDVASAQVAMLSGTPTHTLRARCLERRMTRDQRLVLEDILSAIDALRKRYPDITR